MATNGVCATVISGSRPRHSTFLVLKVPIYFIYFSSVEIDINFLLVFSLLGSWSFVTWPGGEFCWGIIIKIFVGFGGSFVDIRDPYLAGLQINKPYERGTKQ